MKLITDGIYYKGTCGAKSPHFPTEYTVGATVTADRLDTDTSQECSHGIHVCETVALALRWGKDVFMVRVPEDGTLVRAGSKLRADRVIVLDKVILDDADLHDADLHCADLRHVDLRYADLHYADLHDADLHDANLRHADLHYADFHGANLRYADLRGADLPYANLRYVDLRYADLRGADLQDAALRGANLRGAKHDRSTVFPDGFDMGRLA